MPETALDLQQKIQVAQKYDVTIEQIDALLEQRSQNNPLNAANRQIIEDLEKMQEDIVGQAGDVAEYVDLTDQLRENTEQMLQRAAKTKMFNLKKAQLPPPVPNPATSGDPFGSEAPAQQGGLAGFDQEQQYAQQPQDEPHFSTAAELMQWLDTQRNVGDAFNALAQDVSEEAEVLLDDQATRVNARSHLKDALESYFDPMLAQNPDAPREKEKAANQIMQALPHTDSGIAANYTTFGSEMYKKIIESSNREIKAAAEKTARKLQAKQSFNLSKTAQQKTVDNAFLWGPNEKRFDPFYRQPVSDWHVVERNKGFGLTLDDVWNIDYEAIWRGNIMDKYSRPYRDKDGNWVGGYVQKRFEVDKWIPEANNMQLKPGQRRKPRLPEYGVTEARLQANRAKDDRGYGPNSDTSKPFNWHGASKKTNVKAATVFPEPATNGHSNGHSNGIADVVDELGETLATLKQMLAGQNPTYEDVEDIDQDLMNQGMSHEDLDALGREGDMETAEPMSPHDPKWDQEMLGRQRKMVSPGASFASSKKKVS